MKQNLFNLITSYRVKNRMWNQNPYVKKEKMSSYLAFKGGCLEK